MSTAARKPKSVVRSRRRSKVKAMTKAEMVQKMLADQKIIREAIQNGTPLKELEKAHGLKFATLPPPKN